MSERCSSFKSNPKISFFKNAANPIEVESPKSLKSFGFVSLISKILAFYFYELFNNKDYYRCNKDYLFSFL